MTQPRNRYTLTAFSHYLHVRLDRHFLFTAALADALHLDAAVTARRQRLDRVLIEGEAPDCRMDTLEVFHLGKLVATQFGSMLTAYCLHDYTPGAADHACGRSISKLDFFGKVVHNRGGVVGFFASPGEALAWLRLPQPGTAAG